MFSAGARDVAHDKRLPQLLYIDRFMKFMAFAEGKGHRISSKYLCASHVSRTAWIE
jgi:hypothetical protein